MKIRDRKIEELINELPDTERVRLFIERLSHEQPRAFERLRKQEGLLSDVLALSAWSSFLATTILQHPEYLNWLGRERVNTRVRTHEELLESLARFSLTNSQLDPHIILSRFRRRELLRIYLRDIRNTNTLVEITEEISRLADVILQHALNLSQQRLDNLYGKPQKTDKRGRATTASFCIVALGKLGSLELNYASDIDLLFIYSDDGNTSGQGERGTVTNREYFVKLAETVTKLVGHPTGEGAAYRVDVRLRPHGRDGVLASSVNEAVRYYREKAQAWELQAMIRARASAGDSNLFLKFFSKIKAKVYAPDVTIEEALNHVKLSKQKIDRKHAHDREGFNVKLGQGGIREIEFIAQALQLAYGGRDEWLRASHVLVSLGRLAERNLITERERMELFAAYNFLRTLEHRLQMEDGLQTHSIPENEDRRLITAKRMGFAGENAVGLFNRSLDLHTRNVRSSFERIFGKEIIQRNYKQNQVELEKEQKSFSNKTVNTDLLVLIEPVEVMNTMLSASAKTFIRFLTNQEKQINEAELFKALNNYSKESLNRKKAITLTSRIAASLEKSEIKLSLSLNQLDSLIRLCGVSEYFGEMIAANPYLIASIPAVDAIRNSKLDYLTQIKESVSSFSNYRKEIGVLRRVWASMIVEIGACDIFDLINMREANSRQTELAEASLEVATLIAEKEMIRRYGETTEKFSFAVLGLGRLGGRGMDYGSDLDVVLIYDDETRPLYEHLTLQETYSRFTELFVTALSSLTREGSLYRVDLRLRPDGKNGANCSGANAFLTYLKERAAVWEWLAYVKLRFAAGDSLLGERIENDAREMIHKAANNASEENLKVETRRVRERLEKERAKRKGNFSVDIKYGVGGMLDVYFAIRYLQLRDNIKDEGFDRSTKRTIERLYKAESLDNESYKAFSTGYEFLRELDHILRLTVGRSSRLPSIDHPSLVDIAKQMKLKSSQDLITNLIDKMKIIRTAYNQIIG